MKFFIDTADVQRLHELATTGMVDGVTTNPSLIAKSGRNFFDVLREICAFISGPVSAEVAATDTETMIKEGEKLAKIAPNIVIKVPLTPDGLRACYHFRQNGIAVNVTLCFSPAQALLAAKAGASFVSPFVGRLDDCGESGMQLISDIAQIYAQYPDFSTEILVASVRNPRHVVEAAQMGADAATIPPQVFDQLFKHPLTDIGLESFIKDWQKTGQSILG